MDEPVLLHWNETDSPFAMEALIGGELSINAAGCFVAGSEPLLVPPGSSVIEDGRAIRVAGPVGRIAVGETFQAGGGHLDKSREDLTEEEALCVGNDERVTFMVLSGA